MTHVGVWGLLRIFETLQEVTLYTHYITEKPI